MERGYVSKTTQQREVHNTKGARRVESAAWARGSVCAYVPCNVQLLLAAGGTLERVLFLHSLARMHASRVQFCEVVIRVFLSIRRGRFRGRYCIFEGDRVAVCSRGV